MSIRQISQNARQSSVKTSLYDNMLYQHISNVQVIKAEIKRRQTVNTSNFPRLNSTDRTLISMRVQSTVMRTGNSKPSMSRLKQSTRVRLSAARMVSSGKHGTVRVGFRLLRGPAAAGASYHHHHHRLCCCRQSADRDLGYHQRTVTKQKSCIGIRQLFSVVDESHSYMEVRIVSLCLFTWKRDFRL